MWKRVTGLFIMIMLFVTSISPVFAAENTELITVTAPSGLRTTEVRPDLMYFTVDYDRNNQSYNSCEVQFSKNANYSGAKMVKVTSQEDIYAPDLKPNSPLYVRARYMKNGKPVSSYSTAVFRTASNVPSTAITNKTTKAILAKMKKGRSFTFVFPAKYYADDAKWYVTYLQYGAPQYDYYTARIITKDGAATHVQMIYNKSKAKKAKKIRKQMNKIIKKARKKKGTKAKVICVNEQLCKRASYDWAAYRSNSSKYAYAHEPYGCLVKRKAVCDGYAKSFYAITRELKIPSALIYGGAHCWAKAKIGGKWYYVDVSQNDLGHRYTKRALSRKHIDEKSIFEVIY